jgi:hypothetical protein
MNNKKREVINYRDIGDEVNPLNVAYKYFVKYLCYKFGLKVADGSDGIGYINKDDRRSKKLDIRKEKIDQRAIKLRKIEEKNDAVVFYLASFSAFAVILTWFLIIIYFNYMKG